SRGYIYPRTQLVYGVTFSAKQARALGLDWQKVYLALLDDLGVRHLRLSAYWDETEPQRGQFSWQELDWQIEQAERRGAKIILATGARLPRWPECHLPEWTKNLSTSERQAETLNYIKKVVKRYRNAKTITAWQVENEPFLAYFGECPPLDKNFLDKEIALVRSLDKKPIVITDSGELSLWVPAAKRADIFGTTMYRDTYSQHLRAYVHYPIEPGFFRFKKNITRLFARPQKWVVIEMQAEPWGPKPFQELSKEERSRTMNLKKFKEMIEFARRTGFQEFYLWGVEWWYWEKETQDNPALWQEAKKIFNQ
ncbi:hypothetical protein D6821_01805, partial [Candidatus Parcubacteria bacterium]